MDPEAARWYRSNTFEHTDWTVPDLLDRKREQKALISVVVPARDEAATIADVVTGIRDALVDTGLVDELVVMDSDSTDETARVAAEHGARVHATSSVVPDEGSVPGKGEALWKSLFVTSGDLLVFIDADLTLWGPHFVSGLLGPLLHDDSVELVKGFYDRVVQEGGAVLSGVGGRVTELMARPLLNLLAPRLSAVVQPLAGEWAIRRRSFERMQVPTGYGIEIATLLDVLHEQGLRAIAQVDLGRRAHVHQKDHDLSVMAAEVLRAAASRLGLRTEGETLFHYLRDFPGNWLEGTLPQERPPAISQPTYARAAD